MSFQIIFLFVDCGNSHKVRNPTSPNVGTITKLEILLLQCGNYYKVRNPTSPNVGTITKLEILLLQMWELLQS
ncbi:hypothetical protein [Leptospira noguchii]|uniref:Uncharacterized protein n=1 Tax=Leptospira noguchii TaxID=28182 RepID=A0AAE9GJP6_9LEPT|nr:hypothetical protein [Leptospira noguchii]UOG58432.1 hypothetical protein MAL03_03985 [Leptospira noguchii]